MPTNKVVIATIKWPARFVQGIGYKPDADRVAQYFKGIQNAIRDTGVLIGPVHHLLLHCDQYIGSEPDKKFVSGTYVHLGGKTGYEMISLESGIDLYLTFDERGALGGNQEYLLAVTSERRFERVANAFERFDYNVRRRP